MCTRKHNINTFCGDMLNSFLLGLCLYPAAGKNITLCNGIKLTNQNITVLIIKAITSGFGGLVVSMLNSCTRIRGFEPGRSR